MKPIVLIVTDSAYIDTGFARVAREVGTGLYMSGKYEVVQFGWFHMPNDRLVPFRVIPTNRSTPEIHRGDTYGELTFDAVVAQVRPQIVLVIGDEWMISHFGQRQRDYVLMGYVPIDSAPVTPAWCDTFRTFDQIVMYGDFGEWAVRNAMGPQFPLVKIPHGVDTEVFKPLPADQKVVAKRSICGDRERFMVGCVARNNTRKQLPRLLKAFKAFVNPWSTCRDCNVVTQAKVVKCPSCGSTNLERGERKDDAILYLHTVHSDPAGHKLLDLIKLYQLQGHVALPDNMQVGKGVSDEQLNMYYNAFDVFTLPTSAEGWGLPILEAMSVGLPVLVTEYSGHTEFVQGAGEFINVAEWDTDPSNNGERALVDLIDYVMKLDRFYYEQADFIRKWGGHMVANGFKQEDLNRLDCGRKFREGLGRMARERATKYRWGPIVQKWSELFDQHMETRKIHLPGDVRRAVSMEVL